MGRFATAAEFYGYREPYPQKFFETVAARLGITKRTRLLDVGCGPGNLAIGFAPFVGSCTAVDREPEMLRAARAAAAEAKAEIIFIQTAIEDLREGVGTFDLITIGRALHWLSREATLMVLERVIAAEGRIALCGSRATDAPVNEWVAKFKQLRAEWAPDYDESRYKLDHDAWFAPSRFRRMDEIRVEHRHRVSIAELTGRALSFSITSPAVLGDKRPQFEAEMAAALEPFAKGGVIEEEVAAKATIFG
jgi:ubiquinone/menaquinone biosynthesis C-methylase UbiE